MCTSFVTPAYTLMGGVTIPILEIRGGSAGPCIGLVAGVHGNELSSIGGLISFLEEIEKDPYDLAGTIVAIPFANSVALMQQELGFRLSHAAEWDNLNREFPGDERGTLGERMAYAIMGVFKRARPELVVDLHTMAIRSIPFVIIDRLPLPNDLKERVWRYAVYLGLGVVHDFLVQDYEKMGLASSLSGSMLKDGIPSFTVEVPTGPFSSPDAEETVKDALRNLLRRLGMLPQERYQEWYHPSKMIVGVGIRSRFSGPRAEQAGFFRSLVSAGEWVEEDQALGVVKNLTCWTVETVRSNSAGLISNIIDASIVATGDILFELMVSEKK